MAIKIIPYCEVDGIRTYKDSEIMAIYDQIEAQGKAETVFYDGCVTNREEFLMVMRGPETSAYVVEEGGKGVLGIVWLNRFRYHTAHCHFCFLCPWSKAVAAGKQALKTLITRQTKDGDFVFDLLQGVIPVFNQVGVVFARSCGGQTLGVLPNAVWVEARQQSEDAEFIYFTR